MFKPKKPCGKLEVGDVVGYRPAVTSKPTRLAVLIRRTGDDNLYDAGNWVYQNLGDLTGTTSEAGFNNEDLVGAIDSTELKKKQAEKDKAEKKRIDAERGKMPAHVFSAIERLDFGCKKELVKELFREVYKAGKV